VAQAGISRSRPSICSGLKNMMQEVMFYANYELFQETCLLRNLKIVVNPPNSPPKTISPHAIGLVVVYHSWKFIKAVSYLDSINFLKAAAFKDLALLFSF